MNLFQKIFGLLCFALVLGFGVGCQEEASTEDGEWETFIVERLDSTLNQIVPKDTRIEKLGEGLSWSEGPVWVESEQKLLFSDVPNNVIHQWSEESGMTTYLESSGYVGHKQYSNEQGSNGLALNANGELIICQHGNRSVSKMTAPVSEPKAAYQYLANSYKGQRFNSPNDLCISSDGSIYFTDPPYGLPGQGKSDLKEMDHHGVYRINPDGDVELLVDSLTRPNGIALTKDESHLIVANSDPMKAIWMRYDLDSTGILSNPLILYDATSARTTDDGLPDGLKVDRNGNIFATGPGGIWIFNDRFMLIGKIKVGDLIANCALDEKRGWLYLTANSYLLRVKLFQSS